MRRTLSETTDNALPGSPLQEEPSEMSESFQVSDVVADWLQQVQDADRREHTGAPSETLTTSSYSAELKKQIGTSRQNIQSFRNIMLPPRTVLRAS